MPESLSWPVSEYKDRILSIDSRDAHSVLLYVPQHEFKQFHSCSTKEQRYLEKLLYENLPSLDEYTNAFMARLLPCFQELCFSNNQIIFKAQKNPRYVHLVSEGTVKLIAHDNPFSNPSINAAEEGKSAGYDKMTSSKSGGQGTLCASISQNQLGFLQARTWIGEENALLNLPIIYDAIACSDKVRVYRILKEDLNTKLPADVLRKLELRLWPRLNYIRDRLFDIHETRNQIVKLDNISSTLPMT